MYHFSRSIYREVAPLIQAEAVCLDGGTNHERVLRACEQAVERLATDRHYFATPAKTLFRDIRVYFPIAEQYRVLHIVDRHMTLAREHFESLPPAGFDALGNRIECRATTRKGTPCQRVPLAHNGYCPSHQHLAETETVVAAA
jgi:hypothetical protein